MIKKQAHQQKLPPSKLPGVGTTIFTVMSALAREHQAINLSQGFPDFPCAPELVEAVNRHIRDGHNQYAPLPGVPALNQQVARLLEKRYGAQYDPQTEITITTGASEAIFCAVAAFIRPGDEAVILEPAYDCYQPAIQLNGGLARKVSLQFPDYHVPWDEVEAQIGSHTRMIIINSPHNPTGAILRDGDMRTLEILAEKHNLLVLSDEVYEHIIFDGEAHASVTRYPGLASRSLMVSSFGKTLHATGWKVGFCAAPQALTTEFRKAHQFNTFSVATPFQHAIADYLEHHLEEVFELSAFYQEKRDLFVEAMAPSRFNMLPTKGTYFVLADYSAISNEDDRHFAKWLTIEKGVACIPISPFLSEEQDHRVVRFCFAKKDETLKAAARLLANI